MSSEFKKLSHSIYQCKYHIVFCPKYRYRVLSGEVGEYTKREIYRLCEQKDKVEVIEANVQADHVHMIVSIPPKYAVSKVMGFLKSKLALRVLKQYPQLRKQYYWGNHVWSRGYCVSTVGIDEEMIRKYVKWQGDKEKQNEVEQRRLFD
jgi:REP-associated tyrosine transposase